MLDDDNKSPQQTQPTPTTPPTSDPPGRRPRRRAASRPAGPPQAASSTSPGRTAPATGTPPVTTPASTPSPAPPAPPAEVAAITVEHSDGSAAPTPVPADEVAPAKKATRKASTKRSSKKAAANSQGTDADSQPVAEAPAVDEPVSGAEAVAEKPKRRRAAKKTAAPQSPPQAASDNQPGELVTPESPSATRSDAIASPVALLFQAPDPTDTPTRSQAAAARAWVDDQTERADEAAEQPDTSRRAGPVTMSEEVAAEAGTSPAGQDPDEGGSNRRRRSRGGRNRRKSGAESGDGSARASSPDSTGPDSTGPDSTSPDSTSTASSRADSGEPELARAETKAGDQASDDANAGDGEEGSSSHRRRQRRRGGGSGGADSATESGDTVVRVRQPRSQKEAISSVEGSTRIEAKKQRRREGREAGRRRPPILSESEFLARRESVERVMAIRQRGETTQIAVLEDDVLVEHYVALESQSSIIGNVYLGRVQNVLPSMEAAFIDIGKGRNAVLYAGEVNWSLMSGGNQPRRIENALKPGQTILVQVSKDPVGHKGARLTSQVSLPGRYLVYVPGGGTSGISRKLADTERSRLKSLLKDILPDDAGVIIRTAAEGASEEELVRDVTRLTARWEDVEKKAKNGQAPQLLYAEPDTTLKVVRDLFTEDFAKLVISGDDAWDMVNGYVQHVAPDLAVRLERFEGDSDVFASYRIDEQIAKALDRKVWLPSGGSLVIDRTEAMTVVDVNTGKFTGSGGNLEETVTKNNLEAAEEMVRQLRLRDIGGIIVIDFIDMVLENNRDLVLTRLVECLGRDRTRHQVAEVTSLGLVQMTRKRISTGLLEAFSHTCDQCQGRGVMIEREPVVEAKNADNGHRHHPGAKSDSGARGGSNRSTNRRRGSRSASSGDDADSSGGSGAANAGDGDGGAGDGSSAAAAAELSAGPVSISVP